MTDKIEPALSAEEWRNRKINGCQIVLTAEGHIVVRNILHSPTFTPLPGEFAAGLMALANAALADDDPRKITREDVKMIEDAARDLVAGCEEATEREAAERHADELREIAAKLSALLPPDDNG